MAVAITNEAAAQGNFNSGQTLTMTVSSGDTILVAVYSASSTDALTSVTWSGGGGESLSLVANTAGSNTGRTEIWALDNPTAAAGGTVTFNRGGGMVQSALGAVSFSGSGSASNGAVNAFNASTTQTINVGGSPGANDYLIDVRWGDEEPTIGANQTAVNNAATPFDFTAGSKFFDASVQDGVNGNVMSWTSSSDSGHMSACLIPEGVFDQNIDGGSLAVDFPPDPDTFIDGLITQEIEGSLLQDADQLFHGFVEPTNLFGSLLQDADQLFHGTIATVAVGQINVIVPFKRPTFNRPSGVPVLNRASPQADGLVGWFDVGQFLHAVDLTGGVPRSNIAFVNDDGDLTPHVGELGRAVNFSGDAENDRIDLGNIQATDPLALEGQVTFSIFAWVRKDEVGDFTQVRRIIDKSDGGQGANGWYFAGSIGASTIEWAAGGSSGSNSDSLALDDGKFHHLGVVRRHLTGGGLQFFADGMAAGTALNSTTIPSSAANAAIGNWNHTVNRMWFGPIATVGVWNRDLTEDEIWSLYNPATRWDLYWKPKLYIPVFAGAAVAAADQNIEGSKFDDADVLNEADVDLHLFGSVLTDVDTLNDGLITHIIEGSLLQDADILSDGDIDLHIFGSVLTDADQLFHGFVEPTNLFGSLLQDADTFNDGDVDLHILGSLLTDTDTFNQGDIDLHIFGSVLTDADTLNQGDVDYHILGSLLQDADQLFHGLISPTNIFGSLLQDADTLNQNKLTVDIAGGPLYEDTNH